MAARALRAVSQFRETFLTDLLARLVMVAGRYRRVLEEHE
jgi:hypothetical protein